MKIRQISGGENLAEVLRRQLEAATYTDRDAARRDVQQAFPNHIVSETSESICVAVRDRSFSVAEFREIL